MPKNKRESLIYTVMMCFLMVLWMSIYNVALHTGGLSFDVFQSAWLGFPLAYIIAMFLDLFIVSGPAKKVAFRFLVKPTSSNLKKGLAVSFCMVVPMVIFMSLYGGLEVVLKSGNWQALPMIWLTNIPKNFVMALPFQIIIAGPVIRTSFRKLFPEGKVLA